MTTVDQTNSFLDSSLARLLALVIAIALAAILWLNWSADFGELFAEKEPAVPATQVSAPAKPANPALQECLTQRVGDVDRMKEEGILSDAQYGAFRSRAEALCRAQHS